MSHSSPPDAESLRASPAFPRGREPESDRSRTERRPRASSRKPRAGQHRDGPPPAIASKRSAATPGPNGRAVSEVIGAILMFGLLLLILVLVQLNFVPTANQQVEYQHSQRVQSDMLDFDDQILTTSTNGLSGATAIEVTAHYPSRLLFINPGPAGGTIESNRSGQLTIDNAVAPSAEKYWNGSIRRFPTRTVRYRPDYNEYGSAPVTIYEHGSIVNQFQTGAVLPLDSDTFISGNTISLVALDGRFSVSQSRPYSVETVPLSAPTEELTIESDGQPIELTLPTALTTEDWNELLEDERGPQGNVQSAVVNNGVLEVTLEEGTYQLRMARVGVGPNANQTRVPAKYLTDPRTDRKNILSGETTFIEVDVRDGYNNLASGTVTFRSPNGTFVDDDGTLVDGLAVDTEDDGTAGAEFAPDAPFLGTTNVTMSGDLDGDGTVEPVERRSVNVTVYPSRLANRSFNGTNEELSSINPPADVILQGVRTEPVQGPGKKKAVYVTLENQALTDRSVEEVRFSFYYSDTSSPSAQFSINNTGYETYTLYDRFEPVNQNIVFANNSPDELKVIVEDASNSRSFFVMSIIYNEGRATYFVHVN